MLFNFLLLSFLYPYCISVDTMATNQFLKGSNILVSKEGTFALGFFSPGNSIYKYLGIWYHQLPQKTVVWVANREHPIPINDSSAVFTLSRDGRNLVLYSGNDQKFPIWSANVSLLIGKAACAAQLLDSGNLILVHTETQQIVWQSFDYPTNTLLPGMKLGLNKKLGHSWLLTSWKSDDDPAVGQTYYKISPTTSLPQFLLYKGLNLYWRSGPWPIGRPKPSLFPDYLYNYTFVNNDDEIYYSYFVDDKSALTRSVVDNSGLLQRLTWDNSSCQWKQTWSAPKYIYGHCGENSIFNANNINPIYECACLPGYRPKSLKNFYLQYGGCIRKPQQTAASMCRNREGFVKVDHVKVPDPSIATLLNYSMGMIDCEQTCLMNCSCIAFASLDAERKGFGCLMWYGELIDTMEQTDGYDLYVRVDATELAKHGKKERNVVKKKWILVFPVLSSGLTIVFLIFILTHVRLKKKKTRVKKGSKELFSKLLANKLVESEQPPDVRFFDLCTVSVATNNFLLENKLGQGGFGSVYKGKLVDGQEIAVKRLSKNSGQGIEEFKNEVVVIARLQHRNLVRLLGCCIQGDEQMLIYEFMPNKSLDYFIFDQRRRSILNWRKRFEIIVGIARGISYLHHDSRLRIIHRDLKLSNVLLDAEMNPKISDFGMARIFKGDEVQNRTNRVVGTYGYMAPEYATFGKFSIKSDVFSFGVILLEIISGKKSNNLYKEDPSLNLIAHVWNLWREEREVDVIDSFVKDSYAYPIHEVVRCIQIGLLCVEEDAEHRPSMASVVVMLNSEVKLPVPTQPAFVFRRTSTPPPMLRIGSINQVTTTSLQPR